MALPYAAAPAVAFELLGARNDNGGSSIMSVSEAATLVQAHARARKVRRVTAWRRAKADLEYDAATFIQVRRRPASESAAVASLRMAFC